MDSMISQPNVAKGPGGMSDSTSSMIRQAPGPYPLFTVAQVREAEMRAETEYGVSLATLMDRAGKGLAEAAMAMLGSQGKTVVIFCGSGNNGGDGYVCAAGLLAQGYEVRVYAVGVDTLVPGSLVGDAAQRFVEAGGVILAATPDLTAEDIQWDLMQNAQNSVTLREVASPADSWGPDPGLTSHLAAGDRRILSSLEGGCQTRGDDKKQQTQCDLIVDALLGTGLSRTVSGLYAHLINLINAMPTPVLSCDIPSGVAGDTGQIMGTAVKADRTVMMALAKQACVLPPGSECFGEVSLCDILPHNP